MAGFYQKLENIWKQNNSLVCVGLDPHLEKIPPHLLKKDRPIFEFNKGIIDQTFDIVSCYKPQIAYYSAQNAEDQLIDTIEYLRKKHPHIPIVLDSKRGDIGETAKMYAKESFEHYKACAVTVNPYLGSESLWPFLDYKDKGVIILCRTSNPSAAQLQDHSHNGELLFEKVARLCASEWNKNKNTALVVGATYPEEIKKVRSLVGDIPLLIPGIGAQGGDLQKTVTSGLDSNGNGIMISSSRGIIYAGNGEDFAECSRSVVIKMNNEINKLR